jgi:L-amino acid N-acyltransferase YncA
MDIDIATAFAVRPMRHDDANPVLAIFQAGLDTGMASFETVAPGWAAFDAARRPEYRFVAATVATATVATATVATAIAPVGARGEVVGWVAVSPVSSRPVYEGVVEHSVYVHPAVRGRGVGRLLLDALIDATEAAGVWTLQSAIFPENHASLALHRATGFRVVGRRERIGRHHGVWRDVLLLERRSPVIR